MLKKIKVLIVDDSALVRQVLVAKLKSAADIEVIATASDPIFAMEKMKIQWPDVILLDIEMPRMDGITFLKQIMSTHPTPVIICSSLTEKGAKTSILALAAGAVSIITKPKIGIKNNLVDATEDLVKLVKVASKVNLKKIFPNPQPLGQEKKHNADVILQNKQYTNELLRAKVVAIGTSTGGTQALEFVLKQLPTNCPAIIVVQHMPENFTQAFANRLNQQCAIEVREAKKGDIVTSGLALIAPGGKHLLLKRTANRYFVDVVDGPPVSRHKPSVNVLFRSTAQAARNNALGIIMTGMGDDGAQGLKEMLQAGARTLGQDEQSCVVYGMPKEAKKINAVQKEVNLIQIVEEILLFKNL